MLKLYSFLASFLDIAETPIKTTQKCVGLVVIILQESNHSNLFNHLQTGIPIILSNTLDFSKLPILFTMGVDFHLPPKVLHTF